MSLLRDDWQDSGMGSIRIGFGKGLVEAGKRDEKVVALSADLAESVQVSQFEKEFPERFVEVGVAEQNLVTVASGLAMAGKKPFAASYAAFSPGRNWEQIRTTICLNDQPVVIVGSHTGVNVGPDGATHQMLEDIALMRSLPNMTVVAPADETEAEQATLALAAHDGPSYLRLPRDKNPNFLKSEPFEIGKAHIIRQGEDVALFGTGTMTYVLLAAAEILNEKGISAEVVHFPTIKPLDEEVVLASARKCGRVVTAEEAQIASGFGGLIAEVLSSKLPMPVERIGVDDHYGQSGTAEELLDYFGLTPEKVAKKIHEFIKKSPKYHQ